MKKSPSRKKEVRSKRDSPKKIPAIVEKTVAMHDQPSSSLALRRILVPIDFSVHSKNALRYAIPLAEQFDAALTLIYVIEPTIYPADLGFGQVVMPGVEEELRGKSEEELRNLIETEISGRVGAKSVVRTGKPHQEILKEAKEENTDLIVLATHGHTGVEQMLFGSTAMRVVRLAECPVMTIRPQATAH